MEEQGHLTEDDFQRLLAEYPRLLAGEQMNPSAPRRWLLIKREMGVPREQAGVDWWSLDHLFLDQEGILTLVEVKWASDIRLRRVVVAQMLNYADNSRLRRGRAGSGRRVVDSHDDAN